MIAAWFPYALCASVCAALGVHMHQRLKGIGPATAVWMKVIAVAVALPILIHTGVPAEPMFYVFTAAAAIVWCFNDMIYFSAVPAHGAAMVARLAPLGIIVSFIAWFFVKPDLLHQYLQQPGRFALVFLTLLFAVVCAMAVRRCPFSWPALKSIWFVVVAAVIGTFFVKAAVDTAPVAQGVFGYVGIEAALMLVFYTVYFNLHNREAGKTVFSRHGARTGVIVGVLLVVGVILRTFAQQKVEHPAYVSIVSAMDVVWLMGLSRLSGWKDESNKIAGLGIAASALMLALLKIR